VPLAAELAADLGDARGTVSHGHVHPRAAFCAGGPAREARRLPAVSARRAAHLIAGVRHHHLRTAALYLPHFDAEALDEVIEYLTEPDPEIGFPTRVQRGENLTTYKRNPTAKEALKTAESLQTIRVAKVSKQTNVRRLLRLGRLLAWDKLDVDALKKFTMALVKVLTESHRRVAKTKDFKERVEDAATIDVRAVTVGYGETDAIDEQTAQSAPRRMG
jgi:hypothetical protein